MPKLTTDQMDTIIARTVMPSRLSGASAPGVVRRPDRPVCLIEDAQFALTLLRQYFDALNHDPNPEVVASSRSCVAVLKSARFHLAPALAYVDTALRFEQRRESDKRSRSLRVPASTVNSLQEVHRASTP